MMFEEPPFMGGFFFQKNCRAFSGEKYYPFFTELPAGQSNFTKSGYHCKGP